jgi:hypothetical protein
LKSRHSLFLALAAYWGQVLAEPADYVQTPQVVSGEKELDFKMGAARSADGSGLAALSSGFGYGVSDVWFTEAYLKYQHASGDRVRFDAIEWENKFQLTETGSYPVDLGLALETELPRDRSEGYPVTLALLAQTGLGRWQLNGNVLLQRNFRNDIPKDTVLGYQWQADYRWRPEFQYGLQGFGELGPWNRWSDHSNQTHRLGPAVFGKFALGGGQAIRYNAAWLIGATTGAPPHTARLQMEYEF